MIDLTTNRIRYATVFQSILQRVGIALSCAVIGVGSFSMAQERSILELGTRELIPAVHQETQQPATQESVRRRASDRFGLDPFENSREQEIDPTGLQAEMIPAGQEGELLPAPEQDDAGYDLLMRAPLHEAFAEIMTDSPTPNALVVRRPPESIEELPPEYKPEGDSVIWISGYWYWDDEREDFIWISGVWRDAPVGQKWITGYWHEESNLDQGQVGYRWVSGFWTSAESEEVTYLPEPPQPLEIGPTMPAPSDDHFYVPGTWMHQESRYIWRPGYYSPFIEDFVWVPPTYVWTPCGYVFRGGYWDRPFDQRGVVFAPIFFRQPVYLRPRFFHRPSFVINTGLGLLPHLFIRQHRNHYYFGNWYGDRFARQGFWGWSNIGNFGFHQRHYDPLFNYYGSPFARRQNVSPLNWARQQHRYYAQNVNFRPPTIFNTTIINQHFNNQNVVINNFGRGGPPTNQAFLADSLERRARGASINSSDGTIDRHQQQFVRLNEQQQQREWKGVDRDLQNQRRDLERDLAKSRRSNSQATPARLTLPTATVSADPDRQARLQQQTDRRLEAQAKVQQRQAEASARVAARAETRGTDSQRIQRNLEAQNRAENRDVLRDERGSRSRLDQLGQQLGQSNQPRTEGQTSRGNLGLSGEQLRRATGQGEGAERVQSLRPGPQDRDLRRQTDAAQRQAEAAQRQNQTAQRQNETAQRRNEAAAQRDQATAQRDQATAQRQAAETLRRQSNQLQRQLRPDNQSQPRQSNPGAGQPRAVPNATPGLQPGQLRQQLEQSQGIQPNQGLQRAQQQAQEATRPQADQPRVTRQLREDSRVQQQQLDAVQRQTNETMRRQAAETNRRAQDAGRMQQRQAESWQQQQRQNQNLQRQQLQNLQQQQRQNQDLQRQQKQNQDLQRQQRQNQSLQQQMQNQSRQAQSQQRQAADAARQMQNQSRQAQSQQRQAADAARQMQNQSRQAQSQQRQAADSVRRQASNSQRSIQQNQRQGGQSPPQGGRSGGGESRGGSGRR